MVDVKNKRLTRKDWLHGALELMSKVGVESIKIVPLAKRLGVTSGSFYWHFSNRKELYEALLTYWEREMTDTVIDAAKKLQGPPEKRIWKLMEQVMDTGMANFDLAISHWAQNDAAAQVVFQRVLEKRFTFATWMLTELGFDRLEAEARGRMMVVYMMGESTLISDPPNKRKDMLKIKHKELTSQ